MHAGDAETLSDRGGIHLVAALDGRQDAEKPVSFKLGEEMEKPSQVADEFLQFALVQNAFHFGGHDCFVVAVACADQIQFNFVFTLAHAFCFDDLSGSESFSQDFDERGDGHAFRKVAKFIAESTQLFLEFVDGLSQFLVCFGFRNAEFGYQPACLLELLIGFFLPHVGLFEMLAGLLELLAGLFELPVGFFLCDGQTGN